MTRLDHMKQHTNKPQMHQNFIDWMKAVGMFLIVFGHVVGPPFNQFTQPIYPKQLGVAFFLFITAWSLANDSRPKYRVLFNRLFPVYLYGICFALFMSILLLIIINDTNPSNYLPFFLGVNVLFNNFPANPTTWYIGTYFHFLLFWLFFLRGKTLRKRYIFLALVCEIAFRSLLLANGKPFIAYMLVTNWLTVFLFGMLFAQQKDIGNSSKLGYLLLVWFGVFALWAYLANHIGFDSSFPFRRFTNDFTLSAVGQSMCISLIYCVHTILFFAIAQRLPPLRSVSFFARNTLVIFIFHMPVLYGLSPIVYSASESVFIKKFLMILILYVGLAIISEIISRNVDIKGFRERVWKTVETMANIQRNN